MSNEEKVKELVEWVAAELWTVALNAHLRSVYKASEATYTAKDFKKQKLIDKSIYYDNAKQILSHPDLALIDMERVKYKFDLSDSHFKDRRPSFIFATGQVRRNNDMIKAGYKKVIPLALAIKEMEK